jgi:hypothetical protein
VAALSLPRVPDVLIIVVGGGVWRKKEGNATRRGKPFSEKRCGEANATGAESVDQGKGIVPERSVFR